jgi:hypothetical protein
LLPNIFFQRGMFSQNPMTGFRCKSDVFGKQEAIEQTAETLTNIPNPQTHRFGLIQESGVSGNFDDRFRSILPDDEYILGEKSFDFKQIPTFRYPNSEIYI